MEKTGKQSELLKKKISEYKEKLTAAIKDSNQVYITTHLNEDYDAIASVGAMALICKRLKKAPYIVVDQKDFDSLSVEKSDMYEALKDKNFVIINLDDFKNNRVENSLLIVLDTNKGFMTPLKNNYDDFNDIIVIDHHKTDDNTICRFEQSKKLFLYHQKCYLSVRLLLRVSFACVARRFAISYIILYYIFFFKYHLTNISANSQQIFRF